MLPWAEMMRAALSAGIPVSEFWELGVREWRWLSEGNAGQALNESDLANLMKDFPDRDEHNGRI